VGEPHGGVHEREEERMPRAEGVGRREVGVEDHHMVLVPHDAWSRLEEVAERMGMKAQEALVVLVEYGLSRPEEVELWAQEVPRGRGR
jgi:hypothetical protein